MPVAGILLWVLTVAGILLLNHAAEEAERAERRRSGAPDRTTRDRGL